LKSPSTSLENEALLQLLKKDNFFPDVSMQRQVESYVRELIVSGKLPISTKLPPISALARMWQTSDYPVQAALRALANEGLLVQGTKRGTFVAPRERSLRRVCIYHNHHNQSNDFASLLSTALYRLLSSRGIQTVPFFDRRPHEQLDTAPPEIRNIVRHREIDALIAPVIYPHHTPWLRALGVPTSTIIRWKTEDVVEIDLNQFVKHIVEQAKLMKRKRVGFVCPPTTQYKIDFLERLRQKLEAEAGKAGIPLSSVTYTEPTILTISAELNVSGLTRAYEGLGFSSEAIDGQGAGNLDGLELGDNGTVQLIGTANLQTIDYTLNNGVFDPTIEHKLTYTIDTTTGAISKASLSDINGTENLTFNNTTLGSTYFDSANTAYAGFGVTPNGTALLDDFTVASVPEPSTWALLFLGLIGLLALQRNARANN
jgi:DNA-binding transcriptional regulator YhcF (GntR family)